MEESTKPTFVVDASFILSFLLRDGNCKQTDMYFKKYRENEVALIAPDLLYYEVTNGLKSACLTKRIDQKQSRTLLSLFLSLDIKTQKVNWNDALSVAFQKKTSCYDAPYLVLANDFNVRLLTFDKQLVKMAVLI